MAENKTMPRWAAEPFFRLADHLKQASQLIILSIKGISALAATPQALRDLAAQEPPSDAVPDQAHPDSTQNLAQLAQTEVNTGFPLLCAQATISLWADLENGLRTFLAAWFRHERSAKTIEPIQKLKVSLGRYEAMDSDERSHYIIDRLEQEMEPRSRRGIDRFESLFTAFGFETTLDERLKRDLLELYFVRNVLVHRRGIADRTFIQSCPWLPLSVGDQITITPQLYKKYMHAVTAYVVELLVRVGARFGFARSDVTSDPPGYRPNEASLTSASSSNPVKAVAKDRSGP